jgi:hypothetical protein
MYKSNEDVFSALAVTEAARDQEGEELERVRMDGVRPVVVAALATMKTEIAANIANTDLISQYLLQNRRPASEFEIAAAILALGSRLAQKPPLSEEEERAQIDSKTAAIWRDVQIPSDWPERERKLKLQSIESRIEHNHQRIAQVFDDASAKTIGRKYVVATAQLRQELENLERERELRGLGHDALVSAANAEAIEASAESDPHLGRSRGVPPGVTPVQPGTAILSAHVSRNALAKFSPEEIRKLKRTMDQRHGVGAGEIAINARLSGADADEIKRQYSI